MASAEATIIQSQSIAAAPDQLTSPLDAEMSESDSDAQEQRDAVTLAPDAPYVYADLDDESFHATLSGFVEH